MSLHCSIETLLSIAHDDSRLLIDIAQGYCQIAEELPPVVQVLFWSHAPSKVHSFTIVVDPSGNEEEIFVYKLCPS
jgi:hypothetical protein